MDKQNELSVKLSLKHAWMVIAIDNWKQLGFEIRMLKL